MSANAGYVTIGVIANTAGLSQSFGSARRIVAQESAAMGRVLSQSLGGGATLQQVDRVSGTMKKLFHNIGLSWAADASDMIGDVAKAMNLLGGRSSNAAAEGIENVKATAIGATKSIKDLATAYDLWKRTNAAFKTKTPPPYPLEFGTLPPMGTLANRPIPVGTGGSAATAGGAALGLTAGTVLAVGAAVAAGVASEWRNQVTSTNALSGRVGESTETEKVSELRKRFAEEGIELNERTIRAVQAKNREERRLSMETQARTAASMATVDALQARQRRLVRDTFGHWGGGTANTLAKWTGVSRIAANINSWLGHGERLLGETDPVRGQSNRRFGPVRAIRRGEEGVSAAIAEAMGQRSAASESAEARELREANKRLRAIETNTKPQLLGIN